MGKSGHLGVVANIAVAFALSLAVPVGASAATSVGPIQSSPISLTPDSHRLVNVNPDANSISIFNVASDPPTLTGTVAVGGDPRSVAIHPDGVHAYVANSSDGTVSTVDLSSMSRTATIAVGAEPRALALSPNATRLYVANSSSDNLVVFNASGPALSKIATVDLSPFGRSPRAIAVTNNGNTNDLDETIFVTLFFSEIRSGKSKAQEGEDDQREGRVVAISAATNTPLTSPNPILLAPIADSGFNSNGMLVPAPNQMPAVPPSNPEFFGTPTAAFPNQLAAIAIRPGSPLAYVVSTAASPNGPFHFDSNAQGLVSLFSAATRTEIRATQSDSHLQRTAPLNLNQGVNLATTPAPTLFMTNPTALAWRPNGSDAWIAVQQSDLVVRMTVDANGIPTIGAPLTLGPSSITRVDLLAAGAGIAGKAPRGIAINSAGTRAYVSDYVSRSITSIDISAPLFPRIAGTARSAALPPAGSTAANALLGAELFYSGRDRMSLQGIGSCGVCHPDGRSDNVTWMFDSGPRQTLSLDGVFGAAKTSDQRILNWSAIRDEVQDSELYIRNLWNGQGLIDDDRLFLAIGGTIGSPPRDSAVVEQFQQFTGDVGRRNSLDGGAALPILPSARRDFGVATLPDDRVFTIGGRSGNTLVPAGSAVLQFNPRTNKLTACSSAGFTLRHSLGASAAKTNQGERIYAIGGYTNPNPASGARPVATVEEFTPPAGDCTGSAGGSWRTVASLPAATAQFGITTAGGINTAEPLQLVHVVEGNVGSEKSPDAADATAVQRYQPDPKGPGTWSVFFPFSLPYDRRRNFGVATVLRGAQSRILLFGGRSDSGHVLDSVDEYLAQAVIQPTDPNTGSPVAHAPMPSPRADFGIASSRTSNQIYLVGGVDNTGTKQSTIFEYTVAIEGNCGGSFPTPGNPCGSWATRANLAAPRSALGLSSPPGVTDLLPVANGHRSPLLDAIAAYILTGVRPARAPVSASDPAAKSGRTLFGMQGLTVKGFSCATCHGGAKWSRSIVDFAPPPSPEIGLGFGNERVIGVELRQTKTQGTNVLNNVGTFTLARGRLNEVRTDPADVSVAIAPLGINGFNIPSLLSVHETAPYFYSGTATTLDHVLDGSIDVNGGIRVHFVGDPAKRANLEAFLRSIDSKTPIFP